MGRISLCLNRYPPKKAFRPGSIIKERLSSTRGILSLYLKEIYYPSGGLRVLEKALPSARLNGFMKVSEALSFACENRIAIAKE